MLRRIDSPGKFEGCLVIDERLYDVSLDGCCDFTGNDDGSSATLIIFEGGHGIADDDLTDDERVFLASQAGCIVHESSDGFVNVEYFESWDALKTAWAETCADFEPDDDEPDEPDDGDITTQDYREFYQYGKRILVVGDDEDWEQAVRDHMDRDHFYPNVWSISDHGNTHLLSLNDD